MKRIALSERPNWRQTAKEFGFHFHSMYGQTYWDESAYYAFTLKQIEQDIEQATAELHQMCLQVVDFVLNHEEWLSRFAIPETYWDFIRNSWARQEPSLYSRMDLIYSGHGPAKLIENNADTPTSVYETGFWQWLWLEDLQKSGALPADADQFNRLQEALIERFQYLQKRDLTVDGLLHFACCQESLEDKGTIEYLRDCAIEAGWQTHSLFMETIGLGEKGAFTDDRDRVIQRLFKLYPWEFMWEDAFGEAIPSSGVQWLEPSWKALLSNKALLAALWHLFPNHPNLLPCYFTDDPKAHSLNEYVKKPLFSREGANIEWVTQHKTLRSQGPYGQEGFVVQAYQPMPVFSGNHALIGSWLVGDEAVALSVREDSSPITQDLSRFLPHVIV